MKRAINLYLHVHQPWRIRDYSVFDTAIQHDYFDSSKSNDTNNKRVFEKVAEKSYRPMNKLLQKLLDKHSDFKLSLSITGTFIEQAKIYAPDVLHDFQKLVATGRVEILAETYYHSLAFFFSKDEFVRQVKMHQEKIMEVFGVKTTAFRNTELAYNDQLAKWADEAGFDAIVAEGWDPVLEWRSPNYLYQPKDTENVKLLLKNYRLSDDIAFRFGNRHWQDWPMTSEKFCHWLDESQSDGSPLINLFMDYETFGEHQWSDTGIFNFFESMVGEWLSNEDRGFYTVTEAAKSLKSVGEISMPETVTWADTERDLTAWLGNSLQNEAMRYIYSLEQDVLASKDIELISDWRNMLTSDHSYYMCTKWFNDGDVHAYFSPYESPYDAFMYFMNALRDLRFRLIVNHKMGGNLNG